MAVAVQDIIEGARMTHESFSPEVHPNTVCLAFLNRYQRQLMARSVKLDAMRFATIQAIPKATWEGSWDDGDTGVAALAHHVYLDGVAYRESGGGWDTLHLAAWGARSREFRQVNDSFWPAYSIVSGNIFFQGQEEDWVRYSSVEIYYVPLTTALTLSGNITLPDTAEEAMTAALAYHLGQRTHNAPGAPDPNLLRQDWMLAERTFLDEVAGYVKPRSSATQDVW